jgi:hypothetical protein
MYREAVIFRHSFTFLEVASKKHQLLRSDVMFSLSFAVGKEDIVNYDGAQLAEEGRHQGCLFNCEASVCINNS